LFSTLLGDGDFALVDLITEDWQRAAALDTQYADLPLGAERLGVTGVATVM
jgi:hypothetical protein